MLRYKQRRDTGALLQRSRRVSPRHSFRAAHSISLTPSGDGESSITSVLNRPRMGQHSLARIRRSRTPLSGSAGAERGLSIARRMPRSTVR